MVSKPSFGTGGAGVALAVTGCRRPTVALALTQASDERSLRRMLDESEFLSDYGIRALSRCHLEHPYEFDWHRHAMTVEYEAGESSSVLFGGNSNWRGSIWFPVNQPFMMLHTRPGKLPEALAEVQRN